ncbi:MAG TPA: ATP-binding protein [Anaerolineae bacterium]|nr:ATP-binding protein [Anaerolineae bacterium]HQH38665.1 ATP-binding protein [Anaerolineae bacterium]
MTDTVLVVNDDFSEGQFLAELLTSRGYAVHLWPHAKVNPEALSALAPDLIILDLTCAEAYAHQKKNFPWPAPVIISGVVAAEEERVKVFALGGGDYLAKPIHPPEVLARVETRLTLQRLQRQVVVQDEHLQEEMALRQEAEAAFHAAQETLGRQATESTATLRASEAMFRYLLGRMNDGYVIVDDRERVLYANARAQGYLGLGHEIDKAEPPTFTDLVLQQYHREPQAAWAFWPKKMFINKMPVPLYLVCPETPLAKAFWLQVEMLDIAAGLDMEAGRIICLKDITEKTALQEELSRFHSVVAHKLRTPLVPLYTGLSFLAERLATMSRDDILMFVQNAAEGAKHLYSEIEEIIRYLDAPLMATAEAAFSLANFAALLADISADLLLPDVKVTVAESLQSQHLALSQWSLEVILWEILENAKKFHPRNMPVIAVDVAATGIQQARIQVWDDGLTLSPEQLVRMWMPYYQVDKFITGQIAGMGLGLSMVATQVWSVGGTCHSFNREDGPGIVIELMLPTRE